MCNELNCMYKLRYRCAIAVLVCMFLLLIDLDMTVNQQAVSDSMQQFVSQSLLTSVDSWTKANTLLSDNHSLTHQMHIFRMRLLHFVNSLHDYIMTRVTCFRLTCMCLFSWMLLSRLVLHNNQQTSSWSIMLMVVVGHGMRTGAHLASWALKAAGFSCSTTTARSWFQSLTVLTANE